jgi:hypothetical protein
VAAWDLEDNDMRFDSMAVDGNGLTGDLVVVGDFGWR